MRREVRTLSQHTCMYDFPHSITIMCMGNRGSCQKQFPWCPVKTPAVTVQYTCT